jgi:inorganic pyrophosphatase/exopolyphosphatase
MLSKNGEKLIIFPVFVYDRPFDNFENSRNFAMEMVKDKSEYAFWLDADEMLEIDTKVFNKNKLDKESLYVQHFHWRDEIHKK